MSSRLFRANGDHVAVPIAWRQVRSGAAQPDAPAAAEESGSQRLAELARECQQKVAAARAAAFGEGQNAGRRAAAADLEPVLERLAHSMDEIAGLRAGLRRAAESDLLQLALAIARRVLHRQMALDPEALHGLVLAALEKLESQEISRVHVHPSMASQVQAALQKTSAAGRVQVMPDAAREPGALVFETEHGNLDASVDSQLREIERGLTDRLRGRA